MDLPLPATWVNDDADALFAYAFAYQVTPAGVLRLSESAVRRVSANPFVIPAPDVPAAESEGEQSYGQANG